MRVIDADALKDTLSSINLIFRDTERNTLADEILHKSVPAIIDAEPTVDTMNDHTNKVAMTNHDMLIKMITTYPVGFLLYMNDYLEGRCIMTAFADDMKVKRLCSSHKKCEQCIRDWLTEISNDKFPNEGVKKNGE